MHPRVECICPKAIFPSHLLNDVDHLPQDMFRFGWNDMNLHAHIGQRFQRSLASCSTLSVGILYLVVQNISFVRTTRPSPSRWIQFVNVHLFHRIVFTVRIAFSALLNQLTQLGSSEHLVFRFLAPWSLILYGSVLYFKGRIGHTATIHRIGSIIGNQ